MIVPLKLIYILKFYSSHSNRTPPITSLDIETTVKLIIITIIVIIIAQCIVSMVVSSIIYLQKGKARFHNKIDLILCHL